MEKLLVVALVSAVSIGRADKDPGNLVLRPSSSASPVFSSSVDSIPVGLGTSQQSVYAKGPTLLHSSAAASVSGGDSLGGSSGGRNHASGGSSWYTPSYEFNAGGSSDSNGGAPQTSGGYYEQLPQQSQPPPQSSSSSIASSSVDQGYTPSGQQHGQSYTYYYQHYPSSSNQGGGWSGGDDQGGNILPDLGSLGFPSIGGGGAGLKGLGIVGVIAKGILAIKPFLILGLLFLIALPVLFFLLPIPIITITGQSRTLGRSARSSQVASYISQLSSKVLNSEECLERIICKLPQPPEKYQSKAKLLWDEYGQKVVTNTRVVRGLNAYFEDSSQKNRNYKCEQRFKCSNKYL